MSLHRPGHRPPRPRRFPISTSSRLLSALALASLLSACQEEVQGPVGILPGNSPGNGGPPVSDIESPALALQKVQCRASRTAGTVRCGADSLSAMATPIVVGGQGVFTQLTSSNVAYNSGNGQFTFNVTITNLLEQKIGTGDGTTLDPAGIRIFFVNGPNVTSGSGTVSVIPDGFATFTAAAQPYMQYNQLLANGQTSATRTWTLVAPPTVNEFEFYVFVSAPVQFASGYITLDGQLPGASLGSLHPGDTHALTPVMKDAWGVVQPGVAQWSTTNPACASVDGTGLVTGVRAATCQVQVTDGGTRFGSVSYDVTGTIRDWDGSASPDWNDGANWVAGYVPADVDTARFTAIYTNAPVLTSAHTIGSVIVSTGAILDLSGYDLNVTRSVAASGTPGSGIFASGAGRLVLAGTGDVLGIVPVTRVTGTYNLAGDLFGTAPLQVDGGLLYNNGFLMRINAQ